MARRAIVRGAALVAVAGAFGMLAACEQILGLESLEAVDASTMGPSGDAHANGGGPGATTDGTMPDGQGGGGGTGADAGEAGDASTTLTVSPTTVVVPEGGSATLSVTIPNDTPGDVTVTLVGLPAGVTASPPSLMLSASDVHASFTLNASGTAPPGDTTVSVQITGGLAVSVPVVVDVTYPRGALDPTFGDGGFVAVGFNAGAGDTIDCEAMTLFGATIAIAGTVTRGDAGQAAVELLDQSGTPKTLFGSGGVVLISVPSSAGFGIADGFGTAAGEILDLVGTTGGGPLVATVDAFGNVATMTTQEPPKAAADAVLPLDQGATVIAGTEPCTAGTCCYVAKFADGALDPDFGEGGTFHTGVFCGTYVQSLVRRPSGGFYLAAGGNSPGGHGSRFPIAFLADAGLDPAFGDGGFGQPLDYSDEILSLRLYVYALQATIVGDDLVIGAAAPTPPNGPNGSLFSVARWLPDGGLDPAFGDGGNAAAPFGTAVVATNEGTQVVATVADDGGGILALGVGDVAGSGNYQTSLLRFFDDGGIDPGFGDGGIVTFAPSGGTNVVRQADGKILVMFATFPTPSAPEQCLVARVLP